MKSTAAGRRVELRNGGSLLLVDGRQDLAAARDLCRLIRTTGADAPVLLVVTEGGLAVVAVVPRPALAQGLRWPAHLGSYPAACAVTAA